MIRKIFEVCS